MNVLKLLEMIKLLMALCFISPVKHTEVFYQIYTDAASRLGFREPRKLAGPPQTLRHTLINCISLTEHVKHQLFNLRINR